MTIILGRIKSFLINLNRNTSIITKTITISLCMVIIPLIVFGGTVLHQCKEYKKMKCSQPLNRWWNQYVNGI